MYRLQFAAITAAIILLICSCHGPQSSDDPAAKGISDSAASLVQGTYTGSFNKGYITLVVNYASGNTVSGYNIHKGLRRNINGTVSAEGDHYNFTMKEPGGNPYDGTFIFRMDKGATHIDGQWIPLDSSKVKSKIIALKRKESTDLDINTWSDSSGRDRTLTFNDDGTCAFALYERPEDSTSQLITVRGNYVKKADTIRIEWQKNSQLPAANMKMVIVHDRQKSEDGYDYDNMKLKGANLVFLPMEGD